MIHSRSESGYSIEQEAWIHSRLEPRYSRTGDLDASQVITRIQQNRSPGYMTGQNQDTVQNKRPGYIPGQNLDIVEQESWMHPRLEPGYSRTRDLDTFQVRTRIQQNKRPGYIPGQNQGTVEQETWIHPRLEPGYSRTGDLVTSQVRTRLQQNWRSGYIPGQNQDIVE